MCRGFERAGRVLEDHLHGAAHLRAASRSPTGVAVERDRARRRLDEPDDRADQRRLAAPGLADEGDDLAAADVEVDAVDGPHGPPPAGERHAQVADASSSGGRQPTAGS